MILRFILVSIFMWQLSASAQAAPWYQVEVMLVAYTDSALINNETWPEFIAPLEVQMQSPDFRWWLTPSINHHNALMANYGFSKSPNASWQQPMQPLESLELKDAAERISKRSDMNILWHKAWIEPIQEQDSAIPHPVNIRVKAENEGDLDINLTGSFSLYLSRYLHLNTNLIMQHSKIADKEEEAKLAESLNETVNALIKEKNDFALTTSAENELKTIDTEHKNELKPIRAAHIQLQRRMRSKELHYIDHPMLGVIVRVNPVLD